mgnify:CR=1 FL=1
MCIRDREWLDTAVDVLMLLQSARGRKGLSTFSTSVAPGSNVLRSDVTLEVARISENFVAIFTAEFFATTLISLWNGKQKQLYNFADGRCGLI